MHAKSILKMKLCQLQSYQRIKQYDFMPSNAMHHGTASDYDIWIFYNPAESMTALKVITREEIPSHIPSPVRSDNSLRDFRVFPRCQSERGLALFVSGVRTGTTLGQRDPRPASFRPIGRRLTRHAEVIAIIVCLDKCRDLVSVCCVRA
jgi:hypothetical protein